MTDDEDDLGERVRVILDRTHVDACIQCGRCTATCPAALPAPLRAREVVRAVQDGDLTVVTDRDDLWHCTTCFSCQERCPKGVLITQAVLWLRAEAVRRGLYPPSHITALREIASTGNTFPLDDQVRATRGRLSLPLDPPDCAHDPEELAAFHRLIEVLGFEKMAPPRREYGSGGTGVDGGDGEDLGGNGDDDVEGNGDDDVEGNGDDDVGVRGDDDAVENGNDEGNDGTGGGDGR